MFNEATMPNACTDSNPRCQSGVLQLVSPSSAHFSKFFLCSCHKRSLVPLACAANSLLQGKLSGGSTQLQQQQQQQQLLPAGSQPAVQEALQGLPQQEQQQQQLSLDPSSLPASESIEFDEEAALAETQAAAAGVRRPRLLTVASL